jgi:protein-S-isoprenylcysteine O-methyltransferase Ste14
VDQFQGAQVDHFQTAQSTKSMTMSPEHPRLKTDTPDVANFGVLRPPFIYLLAILVGIALDFVRPLLWLPDKLGPVIAIPLVVAALLLFILSVRRFKAAGTPVPGNKPTTTIVRSGPYRFSRNPIYLAFSVLQLAIACLLNSPWVLGTLAVAIGIMTWVVIPREERYLERKFGAQYLDYKAKVRRWL